MIPAPTAHELFAGNDFAPPLVFVHGLEDDWRTWTELVRCLNGGWRAVALDMPWRAGNDYRWRWRGSPAGWLSAGLEQLGESPVALIGHSFGANAVVEALARGDVDCSATVLSMPSYRTPEPPPSWRTFERSKRVFELQLREGLLARLDGRADRLAAEVLDGMLRKVFERIGLPGFLSVFDQYVASGHLPVGEITAPTLVLAGERDPGMSRSQLGALVDAMPDARLDWQPEFDHYCHFRRAPEAAAVIENFFAEALENPRSAMRSG